MIPAWRIVKTRQAGQAFSGEGARLFGGRWNPPGLACVYLADSLALAALELFLHLGAQQRGLQFSYFQVLMPPETIQAPEPASLPPGWDSWPYGAASQGVGAVWLAAGQTAVLKLPSAALPGLADFNYLVNPAHPDSRRLEISGPWPFGFDARMWK